MPSLNIDLAYFSHRKTKRLIGLLGRAAEVLPIRLWSYCGTHHSDDGRLTDYSPQEIETIAEWWGKSGDAIGALVKVGFLDPDGDGYRIHDWQDHAGHFAAYRARSKAANARRWHDSTSSIPEASNKESLKHPTRSPNRDDKDSQCSARQCKAVQGNARQEDAALPLGLQTADFVSAWATWVAYRRERRKALTPRSAAMQLESLAKVGPAEAVRAINDSIRQGWTGIFPKGGSIEIGIKPGRRAGEHEENLTL